MSVPQSKAIWEVAPQELVRRAVERDPGMRTNTGGWREGPWVTFGLTGVDYCPAGVMARITTPEGETSYQWTWAQLDAGKDGAVVPFTRMTLWTPKQIREWEATPLMAAAKVIDDYAGYAAEGPRVGSITVPRWMLVNLRAALKKAMAEVNA